MSIAERHPRVGPRRWAIGRGTVLDQVKVAGLPNVDVPALGTPAWASLSEEDWLCPG